MNPWNAVFCCRLGQQENIVQTSEGVMMGPLEKAKRAIGLRIAETIEMEFPAVGKLVYHGDWDRDRAGQLIATSIPDSNAEVDEWCATTFTRPPEAGPSLIDQIRDAAKFERGTPLKTVLEYVLAELKR